VQPDDVAYLQIASRTPPAPKYLGLMLCKSCRYPRMMVNTEGRCVSCQADHEWAEDNKRMCDYIHRGVLRD
jgi:hypothetical protein